MYNATDGEYLGLLNPNTMHGWRRSEPCTDLCRLFSFYNPLQFYDGVLYLWVPQYTGWTDIIYGINAYFREDGSVIVLEEEVFVSSTTDWHCSNSIMM